MLRTIIKIDEEKCNGCGLCADACHEGAIAIENGKARLIREDYCDGLGNCLPACPTGAITFEEREALEYNEGAVKEHLGENEETEKKAAKPEHFTCPGTAARVVGRASATAAARAEAETELSQWPVQIKLVPVNAPYFNYADLLVAADCSAYAYGNFHSRFIKNHITLIGCPKLDMVDYSEKLMAIIRNNNIKSVTVVRMEVPCCGGIEYSVKAALQNSGKFIPWKVITISTNGDIIDGGF